MERIISIEVVDALLREESHPRAISTRIGVSHTTVIRKLSALSLMNVVDFRQEGKNKVFFIRPTVEGRSYAMMAEWYRLAALMENCPWLRGPVRAVQEEENVSFAVLFGSYARGEAMRRSDIDIFLATRDRKVKKSLESAHPRLSIKIGDYDPDHPLGREIRKDHVILSGVEEFYARSKLFAQAL